MSSADFPDGSPGNPAIIPDTDSDSDGDGDEAPSSTPSGFEFILLAAEKVADREVLGFQNFDILGDNLGKRKRSDSLAGFVSEASNDWERRLAADKAERQRKQAKTYALDLHNDQIQKITQKQRKEDDEDDDEKEKEGEEKSPFQKAKEAIEKRKTRNDPMSSISSRVMELNLTKERKPPTLMEMCVRVLADNSESIESLNLVPDHLKKKLSSFVSDLRKLNAQFMKLLIQDSPTEVFAKNCVDLEEEDLIKILRDCDRASLMVLNLGLCGRSITENAVNQILRSSPNGFPSLTTLSLQGAFRLTDRALALISKSAPLLRIINLSECSLLTFNAVKILADNFGSTLKGLNIAGCQGIEFSIDVLDNSLRRFKNLNYLSVAGLDSISDSVVIPFLMHCGLNLTCLSLASCNQVTDSSILAIGTNCPKLEALDISDLENLNDASLQHLADGCTSLNLVKLSKNYFSDEAVAAFLEVCGGSLNQLCINNIRNVGEHTAFALARFCRRLRYLDLSWCRKLTEEELRLILNSCSLLRSLRLFGWTQVNDEFLEELSRSQVHISGLKMTAIFAHLDESYPSVDSKFF